MKTRGAKLEEKILRAVCESTRKLTPREVELACVEEAGTDRQRVKEAIRALVGQGALGYTYVYGTSFLEPSFDRPVRVSNRIVLKPPQRRYAPDPGEVVIDIAGGAAFGNGAHPTTCLALEAIDVVLGDAFSSTRKSPFTGLDVGTGTGILAIALAKLGVERVLGLDIDPCAVSEASHNVFLNGLAEQVTVANAPLGEVDSGFSVIAANLAYPTLAAFCAVLSEKLAAGGILVLSGFKGFPAEDLKRAYGEQGLRLIREETDRHWVCLVLSKPERP
ncbi:MAG: 50S ribosomal protein L11 methyltransferase [Thermodesulfobacteriota bacterium]|nr:50S ribosomal protein L11 methyltransferase [Thermodesulfobacteriota bacterium]